MVKMTKGKTDDNDKIEESGEKEKDNDNKEGRMS